MSIPDNLLLSMPMHLQHMHNHHPSQLQHLQMQQHQMHVPLPLMPAHPRHPRKRKTAEEVMEAEQLSLTRKRTPKLSINDKVKIIYLHKHELKSYNEIGAVFRCTKSTISGIIKCANDIIEKASKLTEFQSKQKCRVKQSCSYPEVELALFQWLNHQSVKSTKVTDKTIRDRARDECKRIYNQDWKPSNGWLTGFKGRMKRKELQMQMNPLMSQNLDPATFFGESEMKTQTKWIEKIKDMTWNARPELPMSHLLESSNHPEEDIPKDPNEEDMNMMHAGAVNDHIHQTFESYMPQNYSNLSRVSHLNLDSSSSMSGGIHGIHY